MDNHLVSRAFSLYAELLQLHGQGERLSDWLAGAAYRMRQLEKRVTDMSEDELAEQFRPEIIEIIKEGKKRRNIAALEELIQLTPSGLFDMMRIKGLGGLDKQFSSPPIYRQQSYYLISNFYILAGESKSLLMGKQALEIS